MSAAAASSDDPLAQLKKNLVLLETQCRTDTVAELATTLARLRALIAADMAGALPVAADHAYFLQTSLNRMVLTLVKRADITDALAPKVQDVLQDAVRLAVFHVEHDHVELFEMVTRIFNDTWPFYRHGMPLDDEAPLSSAGSVVSPPSTFTVSSYCLANVELFSSLGGFTRVMKRLHDFVEHPLPFASNVFKWYIKPVFRAREFLSDAFIAQFCTSVRDSMFAYLRGLKPEAVVEESKASIDDALRFLFSAQRRCCDPMEVSRVQATFRLEFALVCMRTSSLEKRLAGLSDIKDMCLVAQHKEEPARPTASDAPNEWLTSAYLVEWLHHEAFVPMIFGINLHSELIKRCFGVVRFLAEHNALSNDDIALMWSCVLGKHESIQHVVYSVIGDLAQCLQVPQLDFLFERLSTVPFKEYDMQTVALMRSFTVHALRQAALAEVERFYGCTLLFDLLQDDSGAPEDLAIKAINALYEIMDSLDASPALRASHVEKCIEYIRADRSVARVVSLLAKILATYSAAIGDRTLSEALLWFVDDLHGLDAVFDELQRFKRGAHARLQTIDAASFDLTTTPLYGTLPFLRELEHRTQFLTFVTTNLKRALTKPQIDVLWDDFVAGADFAQERDAMFTWIHDARSVPTSNAFDAATTNYLFYEKFETLDIPSLTGPAFTFFEYFFRYINWVEKRYLNEGTGTTQDYRAVQYELSGIERLWDVAFRALDSGVARQAITLLITLHTNLGHDLMPRRGEKLNDLAHIVLDRMRPVREGAEHGALSEDGARVLRRGVSLLRELVDTFENKVLSAGGLPTLRHGVVADGDPLHLRLRTAAGTDTTDLEMLTSDTVHALRAKISTVTKTPLSLVRILYRGRDLTEDARPLSDLGFVDGTVVHFIRRQTPDPSRDSWADIDPTWYPSAILSQQANFAELFALLSVNDASTRTQTWELLMRLPTNAKILEDILALSASTPLPQLFDQNAVYKLVYALQICDSLIRGVHGAETQQRWRAQFVALGGVPFLLGVLITTQFSDAGQGAKRFKGLSLLLSVIREFCVADETLRPGVVAANQVVPLVEALATHCHGMLDAPDVADLEHAEVVHALGESFRMLRLIGDAAGDVALPAFFTPQRVQQLCRSLRTVDFSSVRIALSHGLLDLCSVTCSRLPTQMQPAVIMARSLAQQVGTIEKGDRHCLQTFDLLADVAPIAAHIAGDAERALFEQLFAQTAALIVQHPIIETRQAAHSVDHEDHLLIGLLRVCRSVLDCTPHVLALGPPALLAHVFNDCLFDAPTADNHGEIAPPKCKSSRARSAAFQLLSSLARASPDNLRALVDLLLPQNMHGDRRKQWSFTPASLEKSTTNYVGLLNQGATCYMNSLVQQLFMIPAFRAEIFEAPVTGDVNDSVLRQLQVMFGQLQESEKRYYDTMPFCRVYKDYGQPLDILQQMDAAEFLTAFFDQLENELKGTPKETVLKKYFGGEYCNQIICKDCPHRSENSEPFFMMLLEIKNKNSVEEALALSVEGETLDGDNKFKCSICDEKVVAVRRACIGKLPDTLVVQLKRFEFNYDVMRKYKVDDFCAFPTRLDMLPYTREGLTRKEAEEAQEEVPALQHPREYYEYELMGILVHTGGADQGHYYSFTRERAPIAGTECRWIHFNDSSVAFFDPTDIPAQCFGGPDALAMEFAVSKYARSFNKPNNAYLLFYQRVQPQHEIVPANFSAATTASWVPRDIFASIWEENSAFILESNVFDENYTSFVSRLVDMPFPPEPDAASTAVVAASPPVNAEAQLSAIKLALHFYLETLAHNKEKNTLVKGLEAVAERLEANPLACQWFVSELATMRWVKQIFLNCPIGEIRIAFMQLTQAALRTLRKTERTYYEATADNSTRPRAASTQFICSFLDMMCSGSLHASWLYFSQLFQVIHHFARQGIEERSLLSRLDALRFFADFLLWDQSPVKPDTAVRTKARMADKYSHADLTHIAGTMSMLVRSCTLGDNRLRKGALDPQRPLTPVDVLCLESDALFTMLLRDVSTAKYTSEIINYLCVDDVNQTKRFIALLVDGVASASVDTIAGFVHGMTAFLAIDDSIRESRILSTVKHLLPEITGGANFKLVSGHVLAMLAALARSSEPVRRFLFDRREEWLEDFLFPSSDSTREAAETFVVALCNDDEDWKADMHVSLLELLETARQYFGSEHFTSKKVEDSTYGINYWRLRQYFRLLQLTLTPRHHELLLEFWDSFWDMWEAMDRLQLDCDENKAEMVRFYLRVISVSPLSLRRLLEDKPRLFGLMSFYISLRNTVDKCVVYNCATTGEFFGLIHLLAAHSEAYVAQLRAHKNWLWALKFLVMDVDMYREAAEAMIKTNALCMADKQWRATLFDAMATHFKERFSANVELQSRLLLQFLVTPEEAEVFATRSYLTAVTDLVIRIGRKLEDGQTPAQLELIEVGQACAVLGVYAKFATAATVKGAGLLERWTSHVELASAGLQIMATACPDATRSSIARLLIALVKADPNALQLALQLLVSGYWRLALTTSTASSDVAAAAPLPDAGPASPTSPTSPQLPPQQREASMAVLLLVHEVCTRSVSVFASSADTLNSVYELALGVAAHLIEDEPASRLPLRILNDGVRAGGELRQALLSQVGQLDSLVLRAASLRPASLVGDAFDCLHAVVAEHGSTMHEDANAALCEALSGLLGEFAGAEPARLQAPQFARLAQLLRAFMHSSETGQARLLSTSQAQFSAVIKQVDLASHPARDALVDLKELFML